MKRFSETEKWKDDWFSLLTPIEKLVFLFLIDNCDNAGFFPLNQRINAFLIGISEDDYLGAIKGLNRGLLGAKDGGKFWIKKFLFHQKNLPLNPANNSHKQIISIINLNKELFSFDWNSLGANEGLFSPIGNSKGIGKGKVKKEVGEKKSFKDSDIFDKIKFKDSFPKWAKNKLNYYYQSADAWSNEGNKKIDWKATINNWATRDELEGRLKFNATTLENYTVLQTKPIED
jgi:hypothetical protein